MRTAGTVRLRKNEERRIRAGHLWIYSNEIDVSFAPLNAFEPGDPVRVEDSRGGFLGSGYINPRSLIAVRLLTRRRSEAIDADLIRRRVEMAFTFRDSLFGGSPFYRLFFGEGDGLPGLVVDRYGDVLVVQPTTAGIDRLLDTIIPILTEVTGAPNILVRADSPVRLSEGAETYSRTVAGAVPSTVSIEENAVRFEVPVLEGQKTGWFYDHRLNRNRLRDYVVGRAFLDVFSYIGGWGIQAACFGASDVVCVDSSKPALAIVDVNAGVNDVRDRVRTSEGDAFEALQRLQEEGRKFDVVTLDPPAFIKRKKDFKEGEQAYRRINKLALDVLTPGGVLVSASCSFHLSRDELLRAILAASTAAGREIQVIEEGHQGPDHPIHPAIPETAYLKAFFVRALN